MMHPVTNKEKLNAFWSAKSSIDALMWLLIIEEHERIELITRCIKEFGNPKDLELKIEEEIKKMEKFNGS